MAMMGNGKSGESAADDHTDRERQEPGRDVQGVGHSHMGGDEKTARRRVRPKSRGR